MKKINNLILALVVIGASSCNKDEESIIDCLGESFFLNVHHEAAAENPKQINFSVSYSGDHTPGKTVKWNFGDGTPVQTVTGLTASHTYATAGSYTAKATVTLNKGACSFDPEEPVTVHNQ